MTDSFLSGVESLTPQLAFNAICCEERADSSFIFKLSSASVSRKAFGMGETLEVWDVSPLLRFKSLSFSTTASAMSLTPVKVSCGLFAESSWSLLTVRCTPWLSRVWTDSESWHLVTFTSPVLCRFCWFVICILSSRTGWQTMVSTFPSGDWAIPGS